MSDIVRTWRHIQQRYNLVGTKCNTCGKVYFPSRVICPDCRRKGDLEPIEFSGKGKIYTFSIVRSPSDDFKKIAPYPVAIVELDEGAKVQQSFGGLDTLYGDASEAAKNYAKEVRRNRDSCPSSL